MSIEEEIGSVLAGAVRSSARIEDWAAALSPLLNRVRAEALRAEANRTQPSYLIHEDGTKEHLVDLPVHSGPAPRLLREQADRIEQNSEGNET